MFSIVIPFLEINTQIRSILLTFLSLGYWNVSDYSEDVIILNLTTTKQPEYAVEEQTFDASIQETEKDKFSCYLIDEEVQRKKE